MMSTIPLTARQHLMNLLTQGAWTARELSGQAHLSERLVEHHLSHIIRSLERNTSQQFRVDEPECQECGYGFRDRTRLKRPSRCPRCRGEAIRSPRFSIVEKKAKK